MGTNSNKRKEEFIRKRLMICIAGAVCTISLILSAIAMGTEGWIFANGCITAELSPSGCNESDSSSSMVVNYGLFNGDKYIKKVLIRQTRRIHVSCSAASDACMWSCLTSSQAKEDELNCFLNNTCTLPPSCENRATLSITRKEKASTSRIFFGYGKWVSTLFFLVLAMVLQLVAATLCFLNTVMVPAEVWLGPWGIYASNGGAVVSGMVTLAIWGSLYDQVLSQNIGISETLSGEFVSETVSLGYSFWLVFVSLVLNIAAIVMTRFRILKHYGATQGALPDDSTPAGAIMLY